MNAPNPLSPKRPPRSDVAAPSNGASFEPLVVHEDRFFDSDPSVRRVARSLYEGTRDLPLVCPHGHVEAKLLADNAPFPEPTALLVTPDHYIVRMLYSQGVTMEALGVPSRDGVAVEGDARAIWQLFADHYHLFHGTPTGNWLNHELQSVFGIRYKLTGASAQVIYDQICERLASDEYRPRGLFERFNIEVLTTTDAASDPLMHHQRLRDSGWEGKVLPCFRPDAIFRIASPAWRAALAAFEQSHGAPIGSFAGFIGALERRRAFFQSMGATSTDHAVMEPYASRLDNEKIERLFQAARLGTATAADQRLFEAHMLMEMARMSVNDGLVMQVHAGSFRDHNQRLAARFGNDVGGDVPLATEFTRNLHALLNDYGNDPRLTLVLFTLDESTYARELAPLAGHYPAVRLGPPWWFHDSIEGMLRFRQRTTETAGIYNTVGFNDDTRAFCSIPARHDLSRRVDANFLAGLVTRHVIDVGDAHAMARALAYDLARNAYKLSETKRPQADAPPVVA